MKFCLNEGSELESRLCKCKTKSARFFLGTAVVADGILYYYNCGCAEEICFGVREIIKNTAFSVYTYICKYIRVRKYVNIGGGARTTVMIPRFGLNAKNMLRSRKLSKGGPEENWINGILSPTLRDIAPTQNLKKTRIKHAYTYKYTYHHSA